MKKDHSGRRGLLIALAPVVLLLCLVIGTCVSVERGAVQRMETYREMFPEVDIRMDRDGGAELLPKNGESGTGLVFYVGAQIAPEAYIPLLARLSEEGVHCFIPKLLCNMAALDPNAAEKLIRAHPELDTWILASHSMGGYTASGYAADHPDEVDGLVFLAAYTSRDLTGSDLPILSVYGDCDAVLTLERYERLRSQSGNAFEEHVIAGANHAQFGDYGPQPQDSAAKISAEEQQAQTAALILGWMDRIAEGTGNG